MITIVDYKAGNLASVQKAFAYLGCVTEVTSDPDVVARSSRLVLPGVGNFHTTLSLEQSGVRAAIEQALARGVPFLGICVGMQWLFEGSEEAPGVLGLAVFPGSCARFPKAVKVPHVGWNAVRHNGESRLLRGMDPQCFVYYTHSYRAPLVQGAIGQTEYGGEFAGAVERDNIFGAQFHPEKSGAAGLHLLGNFLQC
ncbi:MAG: imidazole glycerol phosphate synthase subunit HisH [Terriglobales bacterium]